MYNIFWGNEKENNPHSIFEWILKDISTLQGLLLSWNCVILSMIEQFLYLVGKKRLKFWNHLPSLAKIPAARTDHLLCADTNDLGEISAPRVRINNTLVGGILDFRSVKYIIEYIIGTRRENEQLVGLRFQWKHEASESVPKIQKKRENCISTMLNVGRDCCALYIIQCMCSCTPN